jgi:hypothetical protein
MVTRRLLVGITALNTLLAGLHFMPAGRAADDAVPELLRARVIELVDGQGRVRAQLKVEDGGEAVFRLRDAKGEVRVKLGASEEGSGLVLLDGATEPGIHMLAKRAEPSLTLTGKAGQRRVITP